MWRKRPSKTAIAAIVAGAGLVALAIVFDWNWFRGPVEYLVSSRTGREFHIDGNLDVDLGRRSVIRLEKVRFANPKWAKRPEMLQVELAELSIRAWPLLRGRIVLPHVRLDAPVIALEMGPKRERNWVLGPSGDGSSGIVPTIGTLTVNRGVLHYDDPLSDTSLRVNVATQGGNEREALAFTVKGSYRNLPVEANGRGGALLSLTDSDTAYPLRATFQVGDTKGKAAGTVTGLVAFNAANMHLEVSGNSLSESYKLMKVTLPPTPPYRIAGRLLRDGEFWRFHDFDGQVGDSDLEGNVDLTFVDQRAQLSARLTSRQLDLDDLGGLVGAPPQTGADETASAAQQRVAAEAKAKPRLLPDSPYRLDRLRAMDADIRFTGESIRNRRLPIDDLRFHAKLDDGVLLIDELDVGVAGGQVAGGLTIDARQQQLDVASRLEFRSLQLDKLFPRSELMRTSAGTIGGRAHLRGQGNSIADIAATSDGSLGLAMREGRVSNMLLELVGLDGGEIVKFLFRGDKTVKLRCAVADFDVNGGVMHAKSAVVDTTDTNILVQGQADLRNETLDFTLQPLPKDFSLLSLRSPLHINGSMKDPSFALDRRALVRTGAAALLGALVAPVAALIPLIETGPGKNADCGQLVAAIEGAPRRS